MRTVLSNALIRFGLPAWILLIGAATSSMAEPLEPAVLSVLPGERHDPIAFPVEPTSTPNRAVIVDGEAALQNALEVAIEGAGHPWPTLPPASMLNPDLGYWRRVPPPTGRYYPTAVYDPVRDRMLVFGGWSGFSSWNDVWALSLSGEPTWTEVDAPGGPAIFGHSAVYDPVRDRMLVFVGRDVWALSLADPPNWTHLNPVGVRPTARADQTAIYDPVGDRLIVFGGRGMHAVRLGDVWELSLGGEMRWAQIVTEGAAIPPRDRHSAVYDPVRNRMVVYGGNGANAGFLGDAWALSLTGSPVWTQLPSLGTDARSRRAGHGAVYDAAGDRMIVFAGQVNISQYPNDAWALSFAAGGGWTRINPSHPRPSPRGLFATAYDPVRNRMVVFGGYQYDRFLNDTWALALAGAPQWTQIPPTPSPRKGHAVAYDASRDRMLVYGGFDGTMERSDLWELSLRGNLVWSEITAAGTPPPQYVGHAQFYDPIRDRLMVLGAVPGALAVWALSSDPNPTWARIATSGTPPGARTWYSVVYDPVRDRALVFGGTVDNDVWELTLAADPTWRRLEPAGGPPPRRSQSSAVYDPINDRMIVLGGNTAVRRDAWALSLDETPTWTLIHAIGPAPELTGHTAVVDASNARMLVFGGLRGSDSNDVGALSPHVWALSLEGTPEWSQLPTVGLPPLGRQLHSAVFQPSRQRMVVFGGDFGSTSGDTWLLKVGRRARIDVRPGSDENVVNPGSAGLLPVALFGEPDFDVRTLDAATATLAGAPLARHVDGSFMVSEEDVNADGLPDLMLKFPIALLVIPPGQTEVRFLAQTSDEVPMVGSDVVRVLQGPGTIQSLAEGSGGADVAPAPDLVVRAIARNPGSSEFTVSFALARQEMVRQELFDVTGRRISASPPALHDPGEHVLRIDTRSLATGLYWVRLTGVRDGKQASARMVVTR